MKLKVLRNNILFKFVQDLNDGKFQAKTDWNFIVKATNDDPKFARWAEIVDVGADVTDVKKGNFILIEPLMWTVGMELDNSTKVWATNRDKIIAISKEEPKGLM